MRIERINLTWWRWLLEPFCWFAGHDSHTFPGAPTTDYVGVYCIRCGAHWNYAQSK